MKDKLDIQTIKIEKVKKGDYFWFICLADIHPTSCSVVNNSKFKIIIDEKAYNSTDLKLIKFLN